MPHNGREKSPRTPPFLLTSLTSEMVMSCVTALHMSYTVSAATVAAARRRKEARVRGFGSNWLMC